MLRELPPESLSTQSLFYKTMAFRTLSKEHKENIAAALRGRKHSEETKRKMSINNGRYWLGKNRSEETKRKLSIANKGKLHRGSFTKGNIPWSKGKTGLYTHSEETKRKMSENNAYYWKGKRHSEESKKKMRENFTGGFSGGRHSEETKRKMSKARKKEKHWNWLGGKSFEPYSVDWTRDLKRAIRKRDRYTCQICGKEPATSVHHIDYNKKNCNSDNLVTLCRGCHTKTNYGRERWIEFFT